MREPSLEGATPEEIIAFREKMQGIQVRVAEFSASMEEQMDKVEAMETALARADRPSNELTRQLFEAKQSLQAMNQQIRGFSAKREIGERNRPSPQSRMFAGYRSLNTLYGPTELHKQTVAVGEAELAALESSLEAFINSTMPAMESLLETIGAPPIGDN